MHRRGRGPRGYPARSWALLLGAVLLLCLQVSMSPGASAQHVVASGSITASDHSHSTSSGGADRSLPVAAHDEGRIGRGAAHTPGPAGAVDLDVADQPARPDAVAGRAPAQDRGPVAADPAGMPRGRAPPA